MYVILLVFGVNSLLVLIPFQSPHTQLIDWWQDLGASFKAMCDHVTTSVAPKVNAPFTLEFVESLMQVSHPLMLCIFIAILFASFLPWNYSGVSAFHE